MKISSLPSAFFVSWKLPLVLYLMMSLLSFLYHKSRVVNNNQLDDSSIKKKVSSWQELSVYECDSVISAGVSLRKSKPPFKPNRWALATL